MFQAIKRHGFALGAVLAMAAGRADAGAVSAGECPPPFTLEELWNQPPGVEASWPALKGNVVVLDFWSTKCGPCVQGIPDFNRLVNQCRDLPVRFVAVTDETPEKVRRFLREHPIEAWVGLDTDGSMIRDFEISSRPCVVVVNPQGRIAAVTRPHALSREWIRAVLEGRSKQWMEPLIRLELRRHPGVTAARSGSYTDHGVRLNNASFEQILGLLSPRSDGRLDVRTTIPAGDFDFEVTAKGGAPDAWRQVLRQSLESLLGLKSREEPRSTEVLLLQPAPGRKVELAAGSSQSSETSSPTGFVATSTTMGQLAANLGIRLGRPVLDRTGIPGTHRIELTWDRGNPASLIRAVEEQLGLAMVPAMEALTCQVIEAVP